MARTITPFKLRTELSVDGAKHTAGYKKAEGEVAHYTGEVSKSAKTTAKAWSGVEAGAKFGKSFSASAIAEIGNSFSVSTLGGLIGTAIAPGIGTTVGAAIGGGIDTAIQKVAPIILNQISSGIELNKLIEDTRLEFKTLVGSEQEANKYLGELLGISKDLGILPAMVIDTSEKLSDLTGNLKLTRTLLKAAADQAADFGGSVETFQKVAETLGLIAEKGELGSRELQKLFRLGIDASKYLQQATGFTAKQIDALMKGGRLRGDVAARLIAEGIEREKGGLAALKTGQTISGRERQFGVLTQLRSAEGTQEFTRAIGDFYQKANAILDSPQAKAFTQFINNYSGKLIDFTENALKVGVSVGAGVAEGILNFNPTSMMQSITKLGGFVESGLKQVFEIRSPSELSAREIGEPIGEGIGLGVVRGLRGFIQGQGGGDIAETAKELLKDPRIQALLKTIEWAEGGAPNRIVGGKTFSDLSRHPNIVGLRTAAGPSTAAGSYQITGTTWRRISAVMGLMDFSPTSQQMAALGIIISHPGGLEALRSGDVNSIMRILALDWTSTPGSRIGGGGQRSRSSWIAHYNSLVGGGGVPASAANAIPVLVVNWGGELSGNFGSQRAAAGGSLTGSFGKPMRTVYDNQGIAYEIPIGQSEKETHLVLGEEDAAIVKVTDDLGLLTTTRAQEGMATSIQMRALAPLIAAQEYHADSSIELTKAYMEAARRELVVGKSVVDQLSGMLGMAAGMIPGQEVGKKRGLFSKILGIAAPFLSFIPGVGPILSTIAGIASNAVGGNYAGAVSGIAGGLQSGGVFRSSGGGGSSFQGNKWSKFAGRAGGGPVYAGSSYIVGERRPELFTPNSDGWIHPSVGGGAGLTEAVDRLHSLLSRLETIDPRAVVKLGARGVIDAMDSDSDLIRLHGQRMRLA